MSLKTTFRVLATTTNEAAVPTLLGALELPPQGTLRDRCLATLARRKLPLGPSEILARVELFDARSVDVLRDHLDGLLPLLREEVASSSPERCDAACRKITRLRAYDMLPLLVPAAEPPTPTREIIARTVVELAERLHDELHRTTDAASSPKRNPIATCRWVLPAVEKSLEHFADHPSHELVEAFLLLASLTSETLQHILQDVRHPVHATALDRLEHSPRPGMIRLLLELLAQPTVVAAILRVATVRCDREYLIELARLVGREPSPTLAAHFKHVLAWPWLTQHPERLADLPDETQYVLVRLAGQSGIPRRELFAAVRYFTHSGGSGARRAASQLLAEFEGPDAADLTRELLADGDPEVVAAAASQLRPRGVDGALATLVGLVDREEELIATAARANLGEFSITRYLKAFDQLDEDVRIATGRLVRKIDVTTAKVLLEELRCDQRMRRMRALAAARAMGLVGELEHTIIDNLLRDPDHVVRARAAETLTGVKSSPARRALRQALSDFSILVQEAAETALAPQTQIK